MGFEWTSILLAAAALVVSFAALYFTALKRAEIWAAEVPGLLPFLSDQDWNEEKRSLTQTVVFRIVVVNVGARAGVVTEIRAPADEREFYRVGWAVPAPNFMGGALGTLPMLAGESKALTLEVGVILGAGHVEKILAAGSPKTNLPAYYTYGRGRHFRRRTKPFELNLPGDLLRDMGDAFNARDAEGR